MSQDESAIRHSPQDVHVGIASHLRARRLEIEQAIVERIGAVPDPVGDQDAEYRAGQRATVTAVVDYDLAGIERGEEHSEPIPSVAVAQARRAARIGVRIATGHEAACALRTLATRLARSSLHVPMGERTVWAWLGGQRRLTFSDIERALSANEPTEVSLAVGEPGRGIEGFRLTHRQAQAALSVALHRPQKLTRFADVALMAPWMKDEGLAQSLVELYLSPLDRGREGPVLHRTLREYFAAGRNAKAAAAALGVDRGTVGKRLRTIERLGCPLDRRLAELEVVMRLEELREGRNGTRELPSV